MAGVAVVWRLREPELLNSAHAVASVSTWWSDGNPIDNQFMVWTTDTQLFAMGTAKAKDETGDDSQGNSSREEIFFPIMDQHRLPFLYDIQNHHRTDLTKLEGQMNSISNSNSSFNVAPDGKHIAWTSNVNSRVDVALLNGSDRKTWQVSNPTDIAWERDSKHWRALCWQQSESSQYRMTTASLDTPGIVTPPQPKEAWDRKSFDAVHDELDNEFQVDLIKDQVVSAGSGMRANGHTIKLKAPEGTTINDLIVSPDGRFIAWELQSLKHRDAFLEKLPWLNRSLGPPIRHRMELWVSKADGTEMHEIGYCPLDADPEDDSGPKLILWQPDCKHLSFVYKDFLYLVSKG